MATEAASPTEVWLAEMLDHLAAAVGHDHERHAGIDPVGRPAFSAGARVEEPEILGADAEAIGHGRADGTFAGGPSTRRHRKNH